jgi:hypothetical protein
MNQAERKFVSEFLVKVGTALSADWMRPLALNVSVKEWRRYCQTICSRQRTQKNGSEKLGATDLECEAVYRAGAALATEVAAASARMR